MNDMPSSHSGHLRHVSHLSYLSTISNLNILNPYPLDSAPTDRAFITELNLEDPCLPEGYYEDDLLNPLPIATLLLLHYTSQFPHTSQTALDGHSLDIPLDALDGHSSLLGEDMTRSHKLDLDPITQSP